MKINNANKYEAMKRGRVVYLRDSAPKILAHKFVNTLVDIAN